ncbi:uncharacterized protein LOC132548945 [Ylistrum balloti]|uniref:uncharacterized protein LOC132548945 n=1 Tax=Ylistrum balloti TaxID=509963 RepID=UPI002905DC4B|nr:uncharacterized protein LOC132548945 [Ylistrum balloti]
MVKSDVTNDVFPMDIWGKCDTHNVTTSQTQLPVSGWKRAFRKPQNKFRWYIIIGISVLITLLVVVVIALAIHFTNNTDSPESLAAAPIRDGDECTSYFVVVVECTSYSVAVVECLSYNVIVVECTSYSVVVVDCTSYSVVVVDCLSYNVIAVKCLSYNVVVVECLSYSVVVVECLSYSVVVVECTSYSVVVVDCTSYSVVVVECTSYSVVVVECTSYSVVVVDCTSYSVVVVECLSYSVVVVDCTSYSVVVVDCTSYSVVVVECLSYSVVVVECTSYSVVVVECTSYSVVVVDCLSYSVVVVECMSYSVVVVEYLSYSVVVVKYSRLTDQSTSGTASMMSPTTTSSENVTDVMQHTSSAPTASTINSTSPEPNGITSFDPATPNNMSGITSPSSPRLTLVASDLTVENKKLTLTCEAMNMDGWSDLYILRHGNDNPRTVGTVKAGFQYPSVSILDADFSSQISYKDDAIVFVLESDIPYCSKEANYTCIVRALPGTFTAVTEVKVKQIEPTISVPKSVIAERNITLQCSADIHGQRGNLRWKIRPPGMQSFYDLNTTPVTSQKFSNCSTSINSTLIFLPKASDNGSHFRCVIEGADGAIDNADYPKTDVEFHVIPATFCDDKPAYTIHTHPYSPCNLVIYCFQTGPLVYEINCDPGTCYDKERTKCV